MKSLAKQSQNAVTAYVVPVANEGHSIVDLCYARRFRPENWQDVEEGRERVELDVAGRTLCHFLTRPDSECWFVVYRFRTWYGVASDCYATRGAALAKVDDMRARCPQTHFPLAIVGTLPTHANYSPAAAMSI